MYLPKFTDSGGIKMTPTTYSQEILQSSEKCLKKFLPALNELEMTYTTFHEFMEQNIFQPYPPKLVFQNFTAGETYKLPLQLFNRDNVSKYVKLELPETKYFQVTSPENATGKVAPGLSANFTIVFTPQENKDYQHHLVCVTEKKSFEIPIVAIGPRAILDFRDELFLPVCPVKATSEKTVLVRNVGNCKANFKLQTKGPFSVTPSSGSMKVGESMQVTVTFSPMVIGDHRQELLLFYHTGEVVYISLFGSCEELALQLESKLVLLEKTYISLSSEQTVSLTNTSGVPLQYHWTTHPSRSKQDMPRGTLLHPREQQEAFLNEPNPAIIHGSELLSTAAQDPLPDFSNDCAITLEPTAGEIWPNVTIEFLIIFKPDTAGLYRQTLYCDVTGRESPLCLTIKGEGLGPKLKPNYNVWDMKDVCIGDKDWYEVILTNKGLIDAPFKMCSPDTTFGAFFSFTPVEDVVAPGDSQTVKVTFSSSVLGPFSEDLLLTVKGQPRPQTLNFRGCVNGPTFIFDVTELNFGDVAYGFPAASICTLFNQSFVPMTFSLRVLGDGSGPPSVSCVQQLNEKSRSQWQSCTAKDRRVRPKEFIVSPQTDCVRAMSQVNIKVILCSNTVKTYKLELAVDVKGVGKKIKTLSLNARCVAPYLEVNTPVVDFKSCFLNLPYEQKVQLVNTSSFPACFDFFDQVLEESPSMHVQSFISGGVILPHRSQELPVRVIAKAVGRLHFNLPIAVIGSPHPHLNVLLSCNGQGPIVSVQRHHLDFGQIPVLKDLSKSLCLINQSPIPAAFSASMRQRKSFWHVEPKEGEVPANSQLELRVVAHLKDTLLFEDKLDVSVQDSGTLTVSVKGIGTGYTLVSNKPFAPSLDLGAHFSHGLCQYHFKLTNLGLRTHRMYWRTDGSLDNKQRVNKSGIKSSMPPILLAKKKSLLPRRSMGSSGLEGPVFSLTPSRVELFPGKSVDMVLKGLCSTTRVVNERLVCHSIVGNSGSWDSIMSVDVTCCFVAPMLSISSKQLHFYLKKVAGKSVLPQYKKVLVKNVSTLTLFMNLQTAEPFGLCHEQGSQNAATSKMMTLEEGKQAELWVCLNPGFCEDRVSRVLDEVLKIHYQGHPQQDIVELHGEIHFPNLLLSSTSVDFGCVLNSTEAQREITITNCSPLPVAYHWTFLDQKPSGPRELDEQSLSLEDVKRHSNEDNENTLSSASSLPFSPVSTENEQRRTYSPVKVEETFDVLPIHCHLQPGEQQVTAFSFFGHEYMRREVVARCHVEDGPVYDVTLKGEASQVSFSLDRTCLDFGQKLFDYVGEAEIILKNTGKVGFNFKIWRGEQNENTKHEPSENILDMNSKHEKIQQNDEDNEIITGEPWVFPSKGFVEANTAIFIRILYLPGVPEKFEKILQLQVACLPPQEISVVGEGVFPQINLNLPRNNSQNGYSKLLKQAEESLKTNEHFEGFTNESKTEGSTKTSYTPTNKELLEREMERIIVKENSLSVTAKCLKLKDLQGPSRCWSKITKCLLPEYILDFGSVILGRTPSQTVHINNSGPVTVSLTANPKVLVGTGFSMEFEKVKDLPCGETHDFTVKFDPKEAKLPLGSVCVVLPIQVRGGPTVQVQLCAVVTKPCITVSTEILEFDTIICSMCQIKAVQLFNHECVPCQWSMAEEVKLKKVNKFLPFSKQKQQRPPVVFEMVPSSGVLSPGERVNVLVKFTPLEEEFYSKNLVVSVAESSQTIMIKAQGQGEKPRLDFPAQAFTKPCLPYSTKVEAKVIVQNPCSFPIEFYCLEHDKQYLEEERILRLMQGYDENNKLLLPPRIPGEGLPQELLDFYQHHASDFTNNGILGKYNYTECDKQMLQTGNIGYKKASTALEKAEILLSEINKGLHKELGQLQLDPVSRAITRHMGLDLSPESLAALNRRGIAIIVYGAPKTDIGSTAVSLAQYYGAMLLSIDAVVTEELLEGTSQAALAARQLLEQAAAEISKSLRDTWAEVVDKSSSSSCNGELRDTKTDKIALLLGGDMTSLKTLLPESVLIDILTERFQSSDYRRGIVIDGLKSVFTATVAHTLQVLLKVLNNRKHIYVINIYDSYSALQNREKEQKDAEEAQQQDMAKHEKLWLQELDEDEYDALPEEKKHIIEQHRLRLAKDQIRIRISKEQEQQRQLEDSKRHVEEQKKNYKKGLKKDPSKKEPNEIANQLMSRQNSKETLGENKLVKTFKDGPNNYANHDQTEETKESPINAEKLDIYKLSVDELQTEFIAFEQSQVQVEHILQHWDRVQGVLLVPFPVDDLPGDEEGMPEKITPVGKGKGKKANYKVSKYSQIENTEEKLCPTDVIPHIVVNAMEKDCTVFPKPLPSLEEVLDELGLGPSGPPIPPSAIFSLASFPPNRILSQLNNKYFTFLDPSEQDEQESDSLRWDIPLPTQKAPKKGCGLKDPQPLKDKKVKEATKVSGKTSRNTSSVTSLCNEDQHQLNVELKRNQSLTNFRWIVPANGEVTLRIWFYSETPGIFEQKFSFEMAGTQTQWQLLCKGMCSYPCISKDYMTLFPYSKKVQLVKDDLHKTYVIHPGYFEFGPLLCSKTRDSYKESKYPNNMETLVINNPSGMDAEIQFSFKNDTQATTYLLEPPSMTLKPDESQELKLWAYPTKVGQIKDSIVCHIKDNNEPVVIDVSCWGVRPELELDTKSLPFDKTIIHRRVSRTLNMHNKTAVHVSWRLQGIDDLGDSFIVPQDQGIVPPYSTFPLTLHFRAKKPLHTKKTVRLEVSDVEKILGIVHTENITVSAEAYDVSINIEPDSLDFGTMKVFSDAKTTLKIQNHGKYEIAYRFTLDTTNPKLPNVDSLFCISPQSGKVMPHDKSVAVQIICKPKTDIRIKEKPILHCHVIEPNIGERGETIVTFVTKVSIQAVFSRYRITPTCDINFGPLIFGGKKTKPFIIENTGVFETRFSISCMIAQSPERGKKPPLDLTNRHNAVGGKVKPEYMQKDMCIAQTRLTAGVFSVYPCTAVVLPGSQQVVTVECSGDELGSFDQGLIIDICDRDPSDHPDGIPYKLLAEVYKTGILLDPTSIFEEHVICHSSHQLSSELFANANSVYVTEEKKFYFNKVLVGQTANARFKLTNNSKIPCNLNVAIRSIGPKIDKIQIHEEILNVYPMTLLIPGQSQCFAEVTFTPLAMTIFHGVFEATMDGGSRGTPTPKIKMLEFDIIGEGVLPNVQVIHPTLKNSSGDPLMQFRNSLIGQRKTQKLVLLNDGNAPAQLQIDMPDKDGVFTLNAAPGNDCCSISTVILESSADAEPQSAYRTLAHLNVKEKVEFEVSFCSTKDQKCHTNVYIKDCQYIDLIISVTGEASKEIVSLENITRPLLETDQIAKNGTYEMDFGDCHVNATYQESFTMVNHSRDKGLRFEWALPAPQVRFSPQEGYVHPGCSVEVVVSFCSSQPITLTSKPMKCKLTQVVFKEPLELCDDQQKTPLLCATPSPLPANKVLKSTPDPSYSVVDGWHLDLELRVSAVCDFAKFSFSTGIVKFEDTMLYQTSLQSLLISNESNVGLAFSWTVDYAHIADETVTNGSSSGSSNAETRPSSTTASVVSLLRINPELVPFTVEPSKGMIKPWATQEFTILFSPLEVSQFEGTIKCSIQNLQKKDQPPSVSVCGRSMMPNYHFDLEDSDYIRGGRRNSESRIPIDSQTRVVEFIAVGLATKSTRSFFVLNPTNMSYSFKWRCEDTSESSFQCLTPSGILQPKEKAEIRLAYVSEQMDIVESLWSFVIDALSVSVPFLFVGITRAPRVYLEKALINFKSLLVGNKAEETVHLFNGEDEPFDFSVLQQSLVCDDKLSSLSVQPISGFLRPKERCPLSLSFVPHHEGYLSFRVFLKVKRMLEPLALTVKAECFFMGTLVQVQNPTGGLRELRPNHADSLDFQKVGISEQSSFLFLVSNLAQCELYITLDIAGASNLLQHLKLEPKHATVEVGKQLQFSFFFCPLQICNLQDVRLSIKVKNGASFTIDVKGQGTAPSLNFSFTKHNFGKCLVRSPGMFSHSPSITLVITNKGKRKVSIQCLFENTSYLEIGFQSSILASGADLKIPITFCPQEECCYKEKLDFVLNSGITRQVDILGQGIKLKLEVQDPKHKVINFRSLTLGKKVKKGVVLVNRSTVNLSFSLHLNSNTPLNPQDLFVTPTGQLSLKAGKSCVVEVNFHPRQHVSKFTVEMQAETRGLLHPLLSIRGSCQGVEVHLDQNNLAFGPLVQNCKTSKKIAMMNTGEISAKFCWKTENFPTPLCINPTKGSIGPGMTVFFEVVFAPVQLCDDCRFENLPCIVEGRSSPLTLTVTGSCVMASVKEVVNFICPVRSSHTQKLSVLNPTNQSCTVKPVIEGEQWRGAPVIVLEPLQNIMFEIRYCPFTMTTDRKKHLGSVFFSFVDGTGLLYSLQGTAEAPKAEDTIVLELPAKTHHTELLPVHNWLLKQQQFCVRLEFLKPDKPDATVSLSGLDFIDVPALTKKDYKLSFHAYKTGQYNIKVTFHNEESGEYLFYLIIFKITSSVHVQSTIELVTTVRQPVSATVHTENPLPTNVCLTTECKCADISVPLHHTVPGHSKDSLTFEYLPLHVGKTTARLTVSCNELGSFNYDLLLRALSPPLEKVVHFSASLGTSHIVTVKFTNFSRTRTEYSCKTDYPDFLVDKKVTAAAGLQSGSMTSVDVCFEPHQLGEVKTQLTLHSPAGGEYIFPLHGVCDDPKPQGPFYIAAGQIVHIPFKNVFLQNTIFTYKVNNPSFTVKGPETIRSKSTEKVLVSFGSPPEGGSGSWFGRLTISSEPSDVHTKSCSWTFYLNGFRPVTP